MAVRGGEVYATSEVPNQIRTYDAATGAPIGTFISANVNAPTAIAFDPAGRAYVANFNDNSVSRFPASGDYPGRFITPGLGGLKGPDLGMAFGPNGHLYVPSYNNHKVARYDGVTGAYLGDFIASRAGGLTPPRLRLWRGDEFFISSDSGNKVLRCHAKSGPFIENYVHPGSGSLFGATGMKFANNAHYVASSRNGKVLKYDEITGQYLGEFATGLGSPVSLQVVHEPALLAGCALGMLMSLRRNRNP